MLENLVPQNQIGEWLSSPTRDIHARLVHFSTPPDGQASSPYSSSPPNPRSHRSSSSMAPACIHQPSSASAHPPSLYHYSDDTPTETSISTGLASRFSGVPLLEDVNGVLERRPNLIRQPAYECSFWFLSCSYISYDEDEWRTHCLSHFRGEEPPKSVQCPLCDQFQYTCDNGWTSWTYRMEHVSYHHNIGETLRTSRPDFHLFQHLWQKRLIDDQDLKELKGGNHNLTRPPSNFTVTHGRRGRDGRGGQRHQHVGARRQALLYSRPGPA
ncbi:hypothetical protein K505DRAFT_344967 [Melanomma pulvis-pyrius CBS 109.77]|uniref:Uncharacterized protein n=1 Tax=Melanomma pulvis-pyrius CBS 109.77 TaxID=1314802 RepID=A0A6A6XXF7_9PLEO|nr:hypothetical protein K505DRAFT_344967 [Melanomma pulvis-pyrius CBS 109.77]